MKSIPSYALYGEMQPDHRQDWLHWETIQSRSRLHDYWIAPHRHEQFVQLLHLTHGTAQVTLDDAVFDLAGAAVVVVPALTVHAYRFSADVAGTVLTLMARDLSDLGFDPQAQVLRPGAALEDALARLLSEAEHPSHGHDLAIRALLTLLGIEIGRAQVARTAEAAVSDRGLWHAKAFRTMVDLRYRQTRRIDDYASALGISTTHLNRISRQVLGASALSVIERRLALEARRMLLFSSLSIKEIGAQLGYEDPAYFSRFLTRNLGMAPGALRRSRH